VVKVQLHSGPPARLPRWGPFGRRCIPSPPQRGCRVGDPGADLLLLPEIFPIFPIFSVVRLRSPRTVNAANYGETSPRLEERSRGVIGARRARCDAGLLPRAATIILAARCRGGEQQMLAIGQALMSSPRLLMLDVGGAIRQRPRHRCRALACRLRPLSLHVHAAVRASVAPCSRGSREAIGRRRPLA
jgi:hypothetical protein